MMKQKGASPIIPILIVAILALGAFVFFGQKKSEEVAKDQPAPVGAVTLTEQSGSDEMASVSSSDPDTVVDDIINAATAEGAVADPSADAALVGSDADAINSYVDAYDATNF